MAINDGGPVFPYKGSLRGAPFEEPGLSKRELLAGIAMHGYLAGGNISNIDTNRESVAKGCVGYADALLKALAELHAE